MSRFDEDDNFKFLVAKLISEADIDISGIKIDEKPMPEGINSFYKDFLKQKIEQHERADITIDEINKLDIITIHKMNDSDQEVEFDIDDESDGTQRLFEIAGYWLYVLEYGEVILIDELDRSLHPVLSKALIKMFNNPEINKNNAQLIFTTHDTTLLDGEIFRPDQIWFTEKDNSMTKLYSLFDFRPRENESLQKGYLLGRYGAIPFINGLSI